MLNAKQILDLFEKLNSELTKRNEIAEVGIVGGAVMCLVFKARESTRDVDAIFKPADVVRKLVAQIGEENNLPQDWLNDAAKGYIQSNFIQHDVLNLPNLRVWSPEPKYMLAMKCMSARWDSHDRDDVIFLVKHLKLKSAKEVFSIIENYYPKKRVPTKTQFFIEEIFDGSV